MIYALFYGIVATLTVMVGTRLICGLLIWDREAVALWAVMLLLLTGQSYLVQLT